MRYLEIEAKIAGMAKNLDRRYIRAFWIAFALVNLAFLFYTVNFMFGDHDWNYVRGASAWNEGAFEGRPLHFVLQAVLFDGQVLPFFKQPFFLCCAGAGVHFACQILAGAADDVQLRAVCSVCGSLAVYAGLALLCQRYADKPQPAAGLRCFAAGGVGGYLLKKAMAARSCHGTDAFCLCLLCRGNQFLCRLPARFRLFRLCRRQTVLDGRARKNASGAGYPGGISFV